MGAKAKREAPMLTSEPREVREVQRRGQNRLLSERLSLSRNSSEPGRSSRAAIRSCSAIRRLWWRGRSLRDLHHSLHSHL